MSLTTTLSITQLQLQVNGQVTTTGGPANPQLPINLPQLINQQFANGGAAANLANQFYSVTGTLSASGAADIDLYAFGGATDIGGNVYTNAKIKFLFFQLIGVVGTVFEADYVILGNKGTTAGWTSFFGTNTDSGKIYSGGAFMLLDPGATAYAVGSSTTNHLLTLTAGANTGIVTYNLIVIGSKT